MEDKKQNRATKVLEEINTSSGKKKILLALFIFAFLITQAYPQKQVIPPKRIYVAPNGTIYIQKSLPVYLRLGTSPDDPEHTVLLTSKSSEKYTNPMYFDTDGFNSFRSPSAVDTVTKKTVYPKKEIIFEVYADSRPPKTMLSFDSSKVYRVKGRFYIDGRGMVRLSASDELSGVDKILYSIDGDGYTNYTSPFLLPGEKNHILRYYAYDHVGNVEKIHQCQIYTDLSKPSSFLDIKGDRSDSVVSGKTLFTFNAKPDSSGVGHIIIRIDHHPEFMYHEPVNTAFLSEGDHTIRYYAVDNVGNREETHVFKFYVDKTPPTILQDIIGKSFVVNGKEYSSGQAVLKLTTFDNKAGVKAVYYSINGKKFKVYKGPVMLSSIRGNMSVKAYAVDKVNNQSNVNDNAGKKKIPYIDLTGPALSYRFAGPLFVSGDTLFISSRTKIELKAYDNESGLNHIDYNIDKASLVTYKEPFTIGNEGVHSIEYIGTDNVDNTTSSSFRVIVDNTGPVIYPRFSTVPIGTDTLHQSKVSVYPTHVDLFVAATDMVSGYDRMTYSLNGSPEKPFSGFIHGFANRNTIIVKAYDKLGNETTTHISFEIK